jgi:hypothetical protein
MRLQDHPGWFPVDVSWESTPPVVEWRYLGNTPFAEPFFFQTVARVAASDPGRTPLRTPIEVLEDFDKEVGGDPPTGFVFHMSRCGSTLATRLLASSSRNLVLSEPGAINKILGAPPTIPKPLRTRWLRGLVRALDQRQARHQAHFFVKFSSWSVTESRFIKDAFPGVPCCFLFRDPVEVMVSLLDDPPGWLNSALEFEMRQQASRNPSPGAPRPTLEGCCARLLAHFCRSALATAGDDTLFLNYRSLPTAIWKAIASHFRVAYTPLEVKRMGELARVDAKDIHRVRRFEGDSTAKQARASDLIREMATLWADGPFRELERRAGRFDLDEAAG